MEEDQKMSTTTKVFYEMETKNESFKRMYLYLKSIGIKNNKFMLMIYDKDLIGVDPYDKNLTVEMKEKIREECKNNIWYFFRNVCRIPKCESFELNKHNCAQIFLYSKRISSWMATHRLSFKTGSSLCICMYEEALKDGFVDIYSHNIENKRYLLNKQSKLYNSNLLRWYNNRQREKLIFTDIQTMIYLNEAEYITNLAEIYEQYNLVRESNKDFILIAESVINDNISKKNLAVIHSFNRWHDSVYDAIELSDKGYYIHYSYLDLGKDEEWFERQCIILNNDLDIIRREILIERKG